MKLNLTVNNQSHQLEVDPEATLVEVLRDELGLTGTKINCRKGACGACSIIMNGNTVRSCQVPAMKAESASIITVEGIGSPNNLHPIQQAFVDYGAVQCGFCKPAFVVAAYNLLEKNPSPSRDEIAKAINPVLCRCTGYIQIIEAIEAVVKGEYK